MFLNHFSGFKEFVEPWQHAVKRQYGAKDDTNPPQIVTNSATFVANGQRKTILSGTTIYRLTPEDPGQDARDPKKSSVTIRIGNPADEKDPLMSATAHGQPSKFAGQTFTIPRDVYNFMIQPGPAPGAGGADPSAGGVPPPPGM